jgi:hypothetical protein
MALVSVNVPNFISGVSQQADSLRFPSQAEESVNAYPSLVEGLTKRAPTEHVAKLWDNLTTDYNWVNPDGSSSRIVRTDETGVDLISTHTINRDTSERYTVLYNPSKYSAVGGPLPKLSVFTMDGVEKTVHVRVQPGGYADPERNRSEALRVFFSGYTNPSDLKFLSVADYTLILNKKKTVALTADLSPTRATEAVIYVSQVNYSATYVIRLSKDGAATREASYTTGNTQSNVSYTPTATEIIKGLLTSLQTSAGGAANFALSYTATIVNLGVGSSIGNDAPYALHIKRVDGTSFNTVVSDSQGGFSLKAVSKTAQSFTDLPLANVDGFTVKIIGEPEETGDEYWVKYLSNDPESGSVYRETIKPGIKYKLDSSSLPVALVRLSNGDFLVTPLDGHTATYNGVSYTAPKWSDRLVGDDDTNPAPSFVGRTIKDILFFRNRLTFLSDENVIMSESGSFFNFWRTSVIQLLDSDPIDVGSSSTKVSTLTAGIPFYERLVLFADQTQFTLYSGDNLTAKTVSIQSTTSFASSGLSQPVAVGKNIYFGFSRNDYAGVQEYYINPETQLFDGVDISASIPSYIKGNITKIAGSDNEQIVAFLADGEKNKVYIYKYFFTGSEKLQSAWCCFDFGAQTKVLNVDFLDNELYLVIARERSIPTGLITSPATFPLVPSVIKEVFLEKIDLQNFKKDPASDYQILLDRKLDTSFSGVTRSFNSGTGRTTVTLPFMTTTSRVMAVTKATPPASTTAGGITSGVGGAVVPIVQANGYVTSFELVGDYSTIPLWIGERYTMEHTIGKINLRAPGSKGNPVVVPSGKLYLRRASLSVDNTKSFSVVVQNEGAGPTYVYPFSSVVLGTSSSGVNYDSLKDSVFRFPIMSKNEKVKIKFTNDTPYPCAFLSMDVEAQYVSRSQRAG